MFFATCGVMGRDVWIHWTSLNCLYLRNWQQRRSTQVA